MPHRIPLPVDEFARLKRAGWTLRAIGRKYAVSHTTVANRLKERPPLPKRDRTRRYWNPPTPPPWS